MIASVYEADAADVDIAVDAARKALSNPDWCDITPSKRGALLYKLADLIEENIDLLGALGKTTRVKTFP